MRNDYNWRAVPPALEKVLRKPKHVDIFRMLIQGHTWSGIAVAIGASTRRVGEASREIRAAIEAAGYNPNDPSLAIKAPSVSVPEALTVVEEHRLKRELRQAKDENKSLREEIAANNELFDVMKQVPQRAVKPLKVVGGKGKKHKVAASAFLSDTHFDEVVNLAESGGINEYNREIAVRRLRTFAEKTILVAQDLMSGFDVVHLDLPFGGDMVSGNIHEELARTNQAEIMDTVDFWSEQLAQIVVTLAKEFPTVFIPCVVGNHGRNTKKPRHKGRIRDNFDWLIYRNVLKNVQLSGVKNARFDISDSTDALWETMGHKYLLTHGDQASGGSGWGGIYSAILRLYEKKLKAYASRGLSFDTLLMGHWHQFIDGGAFIVNGSSKGYDEFAHNLNFRAEPPQQAFWLTDPTHGKIFSGPLFVDDAPQAKAKRKAA